MTLTSCILLIIGMLLVGVAAGAEETDTRPHDEFVILLHGLGRTSISMKRVEWYLRARGYHVINRSYPSRRTSVEELANGFLDDLIRTNVATSNARVHFVTHSLGGILVRQYLATHRVSNLGQVVMLGPPNHGSEIADFMSGSAFTRALSSSNLLCLGTASNSLPNRLGPVPFRCGVIAGDRSLNPLLGCLVPRPNDGKVSVASARVEGMADFVVLHATHTWMMWRKDTLDQVDHFLKTGAFTNADRCAMP